MSDRSTIRILAVDEHPLFREGISAIVDAQPDMCLVAEAATARDGIVQYREHKPGIALLDLRLPDMSGVDAVNAIRSEFPDARIVVLTALDGDIDIQRALAAGVRGYILKTMPSEDIVSAIRKVHSGAKYLPHQIAAELVKYIDRENLTDRELQVLRQIAGGNTNKEIAGILSISEETVKVHIKHLMVKLGATDRTHAVGIGLRRGFIELGD